MSRFRRTFESLGCVVDSRGYIEISEEHLPGIGQRFDFVTVRGRRVGVVARKDGNRELLIYKQNDPDSVDAAVRLTPAEANVIAELTGTKRVIEKIAEVVDQVDDLESRQVTVYPNSPADGAAKDDLDVKKRTGASIVAVKSGADITVSPLPTFRFKAGDKLMIVGDVKSLDAAETLING